MTIKEQIRKKNGRPTKHQQRYKDSGRPTVVTESVVAKLEQALKEGFNITHACNIAEISRDTYYEFLKKNPKFADKVDYYRSTPLIASIKLINKAIIDGDVSTAKWYAERKAKDEFSLKNEIEHLTVPIFQLIVSDD